MKKLKKVLAVALISAMTLSMVGCGGKKTSAVNDSPESTPQTESTVAESKVPAEETEELGQYTVLTDSDGNVYDLGGMDVAIVDWWTTDEEEEPTNAYEEARQEYLDWIQETYNFKIKTVAISTWGEMPEDFVNYATAGGDENYVFTLYQGSALVSAMSNGLMYDLSTLDCLDFTEAKWKNNIHKLMGKGDAIYGMRGIENEPTYGMYFNKRILEEAGVNPDSIYEYQESGEWTWAKFEEICQQVQKDTDNDGVIDRHAMTNFSSYFYPTAVFSNGGEFIGKDANGYFNNLESDETMEALNWALDMITKYEMVYPADAQWDYTFTAFANGEAAFSCAGTYQSGTWSEMEDDFGYVCFPKGPKAKDYTNCYGDNVYVIPGCYDAEKAWKIAFAYNLYTEPVPEYEDYAAWKFDHLKNFRDTESVDLTIARMMENGMVTYHGMINGIDMGPDLFWGLSKDNTPAQQAEAIRNTWASYLEEANK